MILKRIYLVGALASLSLPTFAAVDMKELTKEIDIAIPAMTRCEQVFANAQKIKVPDDYVAAHHAMKHNEEISKGSEAHKNEKPMTVSPAMQTFMTELKAARADIEKCGSDYVAATAKLNSTLIPAAAEDLKKVDPAKSTDPNIAKIMSYSAEQQKMITALSALMSNRVMQHRLHDLVEKYFHTQNK